MLFVDGDRLGGQLPPLITLFCRRAKLSSARTPLAVTRAQPPVMRLRSTVTPSSCSHKPMAAPPSLPRTTLSATRAHDLSLHATPAEIVGDRLSEPWIVPLPSTAHRLASPLSLVWQSTPSASVVVPSPLTEMRTLLSMTG